MARLVLAVSGALALVAAVVMLRASSPADIGAVDLAAPAPTASSTGPTTPATGDAGPTRPEPLDPTTPPATRAPSPSPSATPPGDATAAPTPTPRPPRAATVPTTTSARLAELDLSSPPPPRRVAIPRVGLDVPVAALGIDDDGQMAIPTDVHEAGWYRYGPVPGEAGNAVLAGHVDSRRQGLGAFHALGGVEVGDEVVVTDDEGATTTFLVTGRRQIDKDALEADDLFRRDGPAQLVLVTCGGDFDATAGSYRSNVVVVAQPV